MTNAATRTPLLITRPQHGAEEFAEEVQKRFPNRYAPIISPLLEIKSEPCSVNLDGVQALLFSSANAVRAFAGRSDARSVPALCVGDKTANVARDLGFSAFSASGDAGALMALAERSYLPEQGTMLHFRGAETVGDIAGSLNGAGILAEERIIYDQRPLHLTDAAKNALQSAPAVIAPVFSPRTASLLSDETATSAQNARILIIALSRAVAERFDATPNARIFTARSPDSDAVFDMLATLHMDGLSRT